MVLALPGTLLRVNELDGVWAVDRVSGALPPLPGCVKRIHGDRGTTEFPRFPGVPFEVRGLELHYLAPFAMLVDKLEPRNGGYLGHATLLGREYGRFTMRRLDELGQLRTQRRSTWRSRATSCYTGSRGSSKNTGTASPSSRSGKRASRSESTAEERSTSAERRSLFAG